MIDYYSQLFEATDSKKTKIENHIKKIQSINLDHSPGRLSSDGHSESLSSNDSFHTVFEEPQKPQQQSPALESVVETIVLESPEQKVHSSKSLDLLNANNLEEQSDNNANVEIVPKSIQQAIENYQTARRNKEKVLQQELGIDFNYKPQRTEPELTNKPVLTQAQKNKLKVLSSEFGITFEHEQIHITKPLTVISENRNKVMGTSDCFVYNKTLDNERFLKKNLKNVEDTFSQKPSKSLTLDFEKINTKSELMVNEPLPMSVDSTPMSDLPALSIVTTPSTMFMSIDSSLPNTAETKPTDEGFCFDGPSNEFQQLYYKRNSPKKRFSKRVTKEEAAAISSNCLKLFLYESVEIPLATQSRLINDGILNFFINDLNYMNHLSNLRHYFFLQDGEFGRIITDNLFTKLYDANCPAELINCRTLQNLVFGALDITGKNQNRCKNLSFEITNLPKTFHLGDPDVLDCLSLTYKVEWPLNILLPVNTIGKYDEVFKFLLKLNRMSWILKKIFLVSLLSYFDYFC